MASFDLVYKVSGKYWDVESAQYVDSPAPGKRVVELFENGEPASEAYLERTLAFYHFPMGKFAPEETKESLEERLGRLEEEMASIKEQLQEAYSLYTRQNNSDNGGLKYGV